jgi:predicted nucleic acid-binding protein
MIVVDTSAVVSALTDRAMPRLVERLEAERYLHAPYLIDVEVVQVLRRLARAGELSVDRAADARVDYEGLRFRRYRHVPLLERIWELRDALTAYDACFVALAEVLAAPLVTCDAHVARATGHEAEVELFVPGL